MTLTAAVATGIIVTVIVTTVAGMIEIGTGTPMDVTVVIGVTDAAHRLAVDDTRPTTGVAGATREVRLGEVALPEVPDGIMIRRLEVLQLRRLVQMRLGGEHRRRVWAKIKMDPSDEE